MAKKMFCFLLTLLLTALFTWQTCVLIAAEETQTDFSDPLRQTETETAAEDTEADDASAATEPVTVSLAEYPVLTVSAISNYFGRIDAEYNEFTREITVVYMLKSSKRLLSADWTLTYDASLLTVDPQKNTLESICSVMQSDAIMRFDTKKGQIHYSATDMRMFDFSTGAAPFVKIVFDVAPLTVKDSEITKVDLSVNDLIVSEPNPETAESLPEKEVVLVANGKALKDSSTKTVQASKYTTLTPSTFTEPTRGAASRDQAASTQPSSTAALTGTAATVATQPKPQASAPKKEAEPPIYTGTWYMALLILVILLGCSIALFVMRKRDIYNS